MSVQLSRDEAWDLLSEWVQSESLRRHCLAVEAAMRAYARRGGEDEELWGVVGLLHDMDYERHPDLETGHPRVALAELEARDVDPVVVRAIASHADFLGVSRDSPLEKTLYAVDELSGFILACAYVRPEGIHGLTPKSVKKKLKQPSFAAAVNRDEVRAGAEELGVDFDEHIAFVIAALEERADELDLHGRDAAQAPDSARCRAVQRFARVLRAPDVARLLGAAVLARMPIGIDSLGMVLFVRAETGSFARAGLVAAAFGLAIGLLRAGPGPAHRPPRARAGSCSRWRPCTRRRWEGSSPCGLRGRADGRAGGLRPGGRHQLPARRVGRAAAAGGPARRRGQDLLPTAYALDGIAIELVFVTGPLLTAAIVIVASPAVALLVACGFVILGTIVLVTTPASRAWRPDARQHERHLLGALASPGVRTLVAATAPVGFALGATEVTMTAFAADHGSRAAAGALMAAWAAGSGVGGLAYGGREHATAPGPRWVRLAAVFPLCSLPLVLAPSILVMAPLALIAGLCLAPYMAAANQLVGDVAPPGAVTEAFAWPITAIGLGAAAGSAAAGAIAQSWGWREGFVAVVAAGAVTAAVAVAGRATVRA